MTKARKATGRKKTPSAPRARRARAAKPAAAFYRYPKGQGVAGASPMTEEFATAVRASDIGAGLRRFLKKYQPADGEYEDGFHLGRVRAAQFELMRLEYINGNVKAGDKLLSQLQDLDS